MFVSFLYADYRGIFWSPMLLTFFLSCSVGNRDGIFLSFIFYFFKKFYSPEMGELQAFGLHLILVFFRDVS